MWEGEGKREGLNFLVTIYHHLSTQSFYFITPRVCARGEVIGRVVIYVVIHKKSPDLGI